MCDSVLFSKNKRCFETSPGRASLSFLGAISHEILQERESKRIVSVPLMQKTNSFIEAAISFCSLHKNIASRRRSSVTLMNQSEDIHETKKTPPKLKQTKNQKTVSLLCYVSYLRSSLIRVCFLRATLWSSDKTNVLLNWPILTLSSRR